MNNPKDIYEWIELYLLGQLGELEVQKFEKKLKLNKAFAEDVCAIEVEMYEEERLPIERKKQFENRLKYDHQLAQELALHKATFEVIQYFDNAGCCKDRNIIFTELHPPNRFGLPKKSFLVYLQSKWRIFHNFCRFFTTNK